MYICQRGDARPETLIQARLNLSRRADPNQSLLLHHLNLSLPSQAPLHIKDQQGGTAAVQLRPKM